MPNDNPELFQGAVWRVPTPCAAPQVFSEPSEEALYYPDPLAALPTWPRVATAREGEVPRVAASTVQSTLPTLDGVDEERRLADSSQPAVAEALEENPECEAVGRSSQESSGSVRLVEAERVSIAAQASETSQSGPDDFDRFVKSVVNVALKRGETRAAAQLQHFLETQELGGSELPEGAKMLLIERGFVSDDCGCLRPTHALQVVLSSWRRTLSGQDDELDATRDETLDQWASSLLGAWLGCAEEKLPTLRRALRKSGVLAFGMRAA
jgi:hypothetical protein